MSGLERFVARFCRRWATWRVVGGTSTPGNTKVYEDKIPLPRDNVTLYYDLIFWRWRYSSKAASMYRFHCLPPEAMSIYFEIEVL